MSAFVLNDPFRQHFRDGAPCPGERPDIEALGVNLPGMLLTEQVRIDLPGGKVGGIEASRQTATSAGSVIEGVPRRGLGGIGRRTIPDCPRFA